MRVFEFVEISPKDDFGLQASVTSVGEMFTVPAGSYAQTGTVIEDGRDDGILEDRSERDADRDAQGQITLSDGTMIADAVFELENTWTLEWDTAGGLQTVTIGEFQYGTLGGPQTSALIANGPLPPEGVTVTVVGFNARPDSDAEGFALTEITSDIACFTRGTLIETDRGLVAVEDLAAGDRVITLDNGPQPLLWVGAARVSGRDAHAPVRIEKGVLGNDRPLEVSPCHRMLLTGWRAQALFSEDQVLVAAQNLTLHEGINRRRCTQVEYFHLLFETHEIIRANGALSESLNPAQEAIGAMGHAARAEVLALFPELSEMRAARPVVAAHDGVLML